MYTYCFFPFKSCNKLSVNSSSQTAYDIARFWGHKHISNLLAKTDDGCNGVLPGSDRIQPELYFSREALDRQSGKRTEKVWLEAKQSDPNTIYLLFSNITPMVTSPQEDEASGVGSRWLLKLLLLSFCFLISVSYTLSRSRLRPCLSTPFFIQHIL